MKIIAMHLPQFHRIPENDEWWGKGFTEWENVRKGKPFYKGHYQPRCPLHDNYYDLSDDNVLVQQMRLADKYGIGGFCFYHYYSEGKKLLEKPIESLISNKKAKLPFCLAWANHSWARTWYGSERSGEILLKQTYGKEKEWEEHFNYLLKFFKDSRYIKLDGKPIFLIYHVKQIPLFNEMLQLWKILACKNGFLGLYIISMETEYGKDTIYKLIDASMEFEPMRTIRELPDSVQTYREINGKIKEKRNKMGLASEYSLVDRMLTDRVLYDTTNRVMLSRKHSKEKKVYLGAFPGWDNTARKSINGIIFKGSTPQKFEKALTKQIRRSQELNNEFLFINAWNEWSEGAYLEPDEKYGFAYLNAVKQSLVHTQCYQKNMK